MKKIITILFSILFSLNFVNAQEEIKQADWQRLQPPQEEFSVEFPQSVTNKSIFNDKGTLATGFYSVHFNKNYYFARSANLKDNRSFEMLKNYILANQVNNSVETISGADANVYTFQDEDGFYNRILEIRTDRRAYFFQTLSETENDPDIDRFFKSIVFSEGVKVVKTPFMQKSEISQQIVKVPEKVELPKPEPKNSNETSEANSGFGTGSGAGIGNGKTRSEELNSPLKILSKPRASYTDIARHYWIQGSVRLRVTFLENGQIGEITSFTRLPFGLTRNAVEAAKGMKFEPLIKDGKPVTAAKLVEYNFTLY